MELFDQLKALVVEAEADVEKAEQGVSSAGTRFRKKMMEIKDVAGTIRGKVLEGKKEAKAKRAAERPANKPAPKPPTPPTKVNKPPTPPTKATKPAPGVADPLPQAVVTGTK